MLYGYDHQIISQVILAKLFILISKEKCHDMSNIDMIELLRHRRRSYINNIVRQSVDQSNQFTDLPEETIHFIGDVLELALARFLEEIIMTPLEEMKTVTKQNEVMLSMIARMTKQD